MTTTATARIVLTTITHMNMTSTHMITTKQVPQLCIFIIILLKEKTSKTILT